MNTTEQTITVIDTFATSEEQRKASEGKTFEYELPETKNGRTYRTSSSLLDWD